VPKSTHESWHITNLEPTQNMETNFTTFQHYKYHKGMNYCIINYCLASFGQTQIIDMATTDKIY